VSTAAIRSDGWTGLYESKPPSSQLIFLGDTGKASENPDRAPNLFGQDDIAELIRSIAYEAISSGRISGRNLAGPTVALYGRYGQGKSSLLQIVRSSFRDCRILGQLVVTRTLDISHLKPDDVQYAFDLIIAPWFFRRRLGPLLLAAPLALAAIYATTKSIQSFGDFAPWLATLLGISAISTGAVLSFLWKRLGGYSSSVAGVGFSSLALRGAWLLNDRARLRDLIAQFVDGTPDIILIDNLDRATVEQQKALLRSIYRHREVLTATVIVAFDEGPLIGSEPNPESPQELLQKTFDVALQLAPMTPRDAAELALYLCGTLINRNHGKPSRTRASFFGLAPVVSDLARILLFHRKHSVRFGKQFVNGVFAAAELLGIDNPADLSALMRLHGLFAYLPWIRHDPSALAEFMRGDDAEGIVEYAENDFGRTLSADLKAQVQRFVQGTRHMQPSFASWRDFTGRFGRGLAKEALVVPPAKDQPDGDHGKEASFSFPTFEEESWLGVWISWDLAIAGRSNDPTIRLKLYKSCRENVGVPCSEDSSGAMRAYETDGGVAKRRATVLRGSIGWFIWQYLLTRLWIADAEVLAIMTPGARKKVLTLDFGNALGFLDQAIRNNVPLIQAFVRLLPSAPPGCHTLAQAALFASSGRQIGQRPQGEAIKEWLAHADAGSDDAALVTTILGGVRLEPDEYAPVLEAWPDLTIFADASPSDFEAARMMVGSLKLLRSHYCRIPPLSVAKFLVQLVEVDDRSVEFARGALSVLRAACPPFVAGGFSRWDRSFVDDIRNAAISEGGTRYEAAELGWFERVPSYRSDDWTSLFVGDVCGANEYLSGLVRYLRAPADWDFGYLEAFASATNCTVFTEHFSGRESVKQLLLPAAEKLANSRDLIEAQIGERLRTKFAFP
jgi:hypothetical protein